MRHANFIFVFSLFLGLLLSDLGEPVYADIYEKVWDSGTDISNYPIDVEVGDTDGDGMGEIIVADYPYSQDESAEIYIFENIGNDSYQLVWRSGWILTMRRICYIEIGDQDLDGKSEIIAVESRTEPSYDGQLHVFENTGDNSYAEVWNNGNEFSGIESISLFLGDDLDNDGKPEIIVGTGWQCGDHKIRVYENTGDNAYQEVWNSGATIEDTVCEGATGDTDGDGNKEIIVGSGDYTNKALVFENVGDNSYELVWSSSPAFSRAVVANIGDQDADEKAEIIVSDRTGWKVHVYENIGDNEYADVWNTGIMSNYVYLTATGDQDLDGKREIIVPCKDGRVYVFENTGDNSYQEVWNSGDVMGGPIYRVATGDQDDDGKPEIIAVSLSDRKVYVFEADINRPPSVDANGPYSVAEGSSITVNATGSDPDGDPLKYAWDLDDDGTFEKPGQNVTFSAAGLDGPTSCVVAVQATDPGGLSVADQASVTVSNVPPTVYAGPDATINEGGTFASSCSFTDPGADTWSATVDYGDGTGEQPLALNPDKTFSLSQAYSDDGAYTVTVTVDDGDGGVGVDTVIVIVNDLAPTASFTWSPEPQDEGAPVQFTDTSTSSPDAIASWSWDFGDTNTSAEQNPSHAYSDNGAYTVTLTVTDDDGSTDSVSNTVTTSNVAPTADAGVDQTVDEGDTVSFSGSFSDPGSADSHTIEWTFGDNGTASGTLIPDHTYVDDGIYTVTLTVTDDDGGVGTDTLTVTVNNLPPIVDAGSDAATDEGTEIAFSGSFIDPGVLDTHTIAWDFGDNGSATGTLNPSHAYGDNGVYTVTLTVTDDDGGVGADTLAVTVNNVPPDVGQINASLDPIEVNTEVNASADFSDPGWLDNHTAVWNWGDGTEDTLEDVTSPVTGSYHYDTPGVYTVTVTVTDDDSGSDFSKFEYIVIYDPNGGFVTGGGWIMSPEGACAADPTLTGKANFGFVSKYKKGADLPTGETEFNFRVADLNFHSESYEWLVVAGPKAQYKGVGTINGDGNYGFMLTAIDEKLTPSTDVDLFRMRIWDKDADDDTVYDNQMGDGDDADPSTAIGGGSIVIHKEDGDDPPLAPSLPSFAPKLKRLLAAYPNPGNPEIWLPYQLDSACQVVIRIYDMSGRLVRALNLGEKQAGHYISNEQAAYWDGRNEAGESVASGIYFYSIQAGEFTATKKMIIAK